MDDGDMLAMLNRAELALAPKGGLLDTPDDWNTLDVDYEPPRVERLWTEFEDGRLYLHKIHPCDKALYHPHPWPSAIKITWGRYEMAVGYHRGMPGENQHHAGQTPPPPPFASLLVLVPGSTYEMIRPGGWHYVRPLGYPSYSIMVTGPKWRGVWSPKVDRKLEPLDDLTKASMLESFRSFYGR